ncbi:hypothetical protein OH77DRAFT_1520199 [Trametes cingulata]|nr:hypothetical protein OH77DRAFT_1520199 [Trametes cingulata]
MQSSPNLPVHNASDSKVVPRRKSPPPSFINLDDCKPIISTTTTNTSSNSSNHGTTAFVFTSSRTLRALQEQGEHRLSPGSPLPSSPGTPPTPSSTSSTGSRRAQLTLQQLTKHSEGAVDARSLIGPKMRAAGFINLPHTLGSRSDLSSLGTPSSPSLVYPVSGLFPPTPSDPPNFPPIVFVSPSVATTMPMWEYQRDVRWSFSPTDRRTHGSYHSNSSNEPTPGPGQAESPSFFSSKATHSPRRVDKPELPGSHSSDSAGNSSSSSSTLVSAGSSPSTGLTSVEETDEEEAALEKSDKGKAKAKEHEPTEYPFPPAYDPAHSPRSGRSCGSRASSATASPTVYAGPASNTRPFSSVCVSAVSSLSSQRQGSTAVVKPPSPPRSRRSSDEKRDKAKAKEKPPAEPPRSFATAKRPQYQRQFSLTELCDQSPFAWLTKSDVFAPPAPISRSPIRTSSIAPSALSSMSRPRAVVDVAPPPHRRHHTAPDNVPTLASERHHRIASAPLRMPAIVSDGASDQGSEKSSTNRATKARTPADEAETHRSTGCAAASGAHVPAQQSAGGLLSTGARGRDTRGKVLGASVTAKERAAAAETDLDIVLEKATEDLTAMVLAHRERDREYARHVAADRERDKLVKQKQRVHHKLRGKLVHDDDPSESETTMVDQQVTVVKAVD